MTRSVWASIHLFCADLNAGRVVADGVCIFQLSDIESITLISLYSVCVCVIVMRAYGRVCVCVMCLCVRARVRARPRVRAGMPAYVCVSGYVCVCLL